MVTASAKCKFTTINNNVYNYRAFSAKLYLRYIDVYKVQEHGNGENGQVLSHGRQPQMIVSPGDQC